MYRAFLAATVAIALPASALAQNDECAAALPLSNGVERDAVAVRELHRPGPLV